ncbi:signal recognition particle 68 [Haemaphysalis longicornis]
MPAEVEKATGDQAGDAKPTEEPQKTVLTLEILQVIKDAQQKHGLRHGDYQRYRGYCSRRLRRLRKSLHFLQGSKHRYQGREVTEEQLASGDPRYLLLGLVQCERAWAHAMQLRQEANTEPRKRFHLFGRLRKAVKHAQALAALCTSSVWCDARCKLEAQAYCAYLEGTLSTEMQQWKEAMESFHKAQTIYEKLAQALGEGQRALYQQRVDELSPSLRYCAYNIGDETAISDLKRMRVQGNVSMATELDHLIEQAREKQASSLSEVTWLGRTVAVRHEKVRLLLLAAQEAPRELAQAPDLEAKIAVHERLLFDCKDALQLLREDLRAEGGGPPAKGAPVSALQLLHSYLVYLRQRTTVERNLLLIKQLQQNQAGAPRKPQDLARPYEIIVQCLGEMLQLPGVEEGSDFAEQIQAELLLYKAHRVHHIGQALAAAGRYPETMALYRRGRHYVQQALAAASHLTEEAVTSLKDLDSLLEGQEYSVHAQSILGSTAEAPDKAEDKEVELLIDRLDTYLEDKSLTTSKPRIAAFPPPFEPIPCKPLFFDLALNHVQFPSLDDVTDTKKGQGLTGIVKGWLGGWKK